MPEESHQVFTTHKTQVFLDSEQKLLHRVPSTADSSLRPVCVQFLTGEESGGVRLFTIKDNVIRYIQSIDAQGKVIESDSPAEFEYVKNVDGSFSVVQGKKLLSARRGSGVFDFRNLNREWEHLFVEPKNEPAIIDTPDEETEEELPREVYRIRTFHGTEIFVDKNLQIQHVIIQSVPVDYLPLYAAFVGNGVILFTIDNDRLKYACKITDSGLEFGDEATVIDVLKNKNGSVSFGRDGKFLSAGRKGRFGVTPEARAWEQYRSVKVGFKLLPSTGKIVDSPSHTQCKVSIIIPIVNSASLAATLDSIGKQTFRDYEVVLVGNSGTTNISIDESIRDVLRNKLTIISTNINADMPLGMLYNAGIRFAGGRYVLLMGSGDELEPAALKNMYELAEKTNADAMYCTSMDESIILRLDVAERIRKFVNDRFGTDARGRLLKREFLIGNKIEFPQLKAAEEFVYSFYLACLAQSYVLTPNKQWKFGAAVDVPSKELNFLKITTDASENLDRFINTREFFNQFPPYRHMILSMVLNKLNNYCQKYLNRKNMAPYELYETALKEVQENSSALNRAAYSAYNFCVANWQYAQQLKNEHAQGKI